VTEGEETGVAASPFFEQLHGGFEEALRYSLIPPPRLYRERSEKSETPPLSDKI
jgi:hypothetical protein